MSEEAMLDIQRTLGRIEQKIDGHMEDFREHVTADAEMGKAIRAIELKYAKQRGFISAVGVFGSAVGGVASYILHRFLTTSH